VIFDDNGYPVYADEKGNYVITALGTRLDTAVLGEPEPLNQVRVIQGTSGRTDPPGKHFFQQFYNLIGTFEDGDGTIRDLWEYDLVIKITGIDTETVRALTPQPNFKPTPEDMVFAPRYDLAAFAKPWPNDAIEDVLNDRDYNEVVAEYGIVTQPQLKPVRSALDDTVIAKNATPVKPAKAKKVAVAEEEESLFDD
jgi:hypothetical protein